MNDPEKAGVGAAVAVALATNAEVDIAKAIEALVGATPETFRAAMAALRKTKPHMLVELEQFEMMVVGLRSKRAAGQ